MLFYSNRKAHPFSISDVPIYKSIFHLLQAPPVPVYKPLFFNVSSTILMTAHIFKGFRLFCFLLWLAVCRQAGSQVLLRQARVRCRMSFACAVSCSVVSPVGIPFSSTISEYSAILCLRFSALICLYFQHSTLHGFFSLVYKRNCKTNSVLYAIIRHTKNSQRRKHGCAIFFVGSRAEKA